MSLESFLESLDEAAVAPQQIRAQKYALMVYGGNTTKELLLYDIQKFSRFLENTSDFHDHRNDLDDDDDFDYMDLLVMALKKYTLGTIKISMNRYCKAFGVDASGAEPGYGPFMYDAAMSLIYPNYLTSDRHTVSGQAQNVWKYFYSKRQDVEKVMLSSACEIEGGPENGHMRYLERLTDLEDFGKSSAPADKIRVEKIRAQLAASSTAPFMTKYRTKKPLNLKQLIKITRTELGKF